MLLFQTHIYDVHAHTDATLRRPLCLVVIECVVQSVDKQPHRPLLLQHSGCTMTTITCKRHRWLSVAAAITRVLKSLVTGSFHSLLIYVLKLVSH